MTTMNTTPVAATRSYAIPIGLVDLASDASGQIENLIAMLEREGVHEEQFRDVLRMSLQRIRELNFVVMTVVRDDETCDPAEMRSVVNGGQPGACLALS